MGDVRKLRNDLLNEVSRMSESEVKAQARVSLFFFS